MKRSLRYLKCQITKAEKRALTMQDYNIYSLRHFLHELGQDYEALKELFNDEDGDGGELSEKVFEEYQEKYDKATALFQEEIDKRLDRKPGDVLNSSETSDRFMVSLLERQRDLNETIGRLAMNLPTKENKLPTLKIPIFGGCYKDWVRFKNLFLNRIDRNPSLNNVEKLGHLQTLVISEAASVIKHLPLSDESYAQAWELLKSKYDKPYKIGNNLISEIMALPSVNPKVGVRSHYQLLTETLAALDSLGEYSKTRDPWIIHIMVEKFDKELRQRWAREIANDDSPSLDQFLEFLSAENDAIDNTGFDEQKENDKSSKSIKWSMKNLKVNAAFQSACFVCSENHKIYDCQKFKEMSVKLRTDLARTKNRCLNCLTSGHFVANCASKGRCSKCGRRHNTLLHYENMERVTTAEKKNSNNSKSTPDPLLKVNISSSENGNSHILPTAIIQALGSDGRYVNCQVLLDSGSQAAFITERCVERLRLDRSGPGVSFETMSSINSQKSKGTVESIFRSIYDERDIFTSRLHVINRITGCLPGKLVKYGGKELLRERFDLADPEFDVPAEVDILFGAEFLLSIIKSQKYYHLVDKLWILESSLGWLVSGGDGNSNLKVNCNFNLDSDRKLTELVSRFWEVNDESEKQCQADDDIYCEDLFKSSVLKLESGRYSVDLPFRRNVGSLGNSYFLAKNRLTALEKKFKANEHFKSEYCRIMRNFEDDGFIERIAREEIRKDTLTYYLPHHGVGFGRTKLRIVFDASMKTDNGKSLNDVLLTGPNLQPDLRMLLLEFRFFRYVFVADIKQMYRQISINPGCREVQRFLWRENTDCEVSEYRIVTVTDGLVCSPYLALRTMIQLAQDEEVNYPLATQYLAKRYMDDFFIGNNSIEDLKEIKNQMIGALSSARMSLGKWCSNDQTLLNDVCDDDKLIGDTMEIRSSETVKTLGIHWNCSDDIFTYRLDFEPPLKYTRRTLLADSAKFYDPLGWIVPVTVSLKMLFQEACVKRLEWDDNLPEDLVLRWLNLRDKMSQLSEVRVPRWLQCGNGMEPHGFCDASGKAYACVVYSRCTDFNGEVMIRIVLARSRVAPIKPLSIARLELCAANLLAESLSMILKTFERWNPRSFCWTDSTTVLAWLAATPNRWNTFVAHRCGNIHTILPHSRWKYISSKQNPADVASRGVDAKTLLSHRLWWSGPIMLKTFSSDMIDDSVMDTDMEERRSSEKCMLISSDNFWKTYLDRYSSFNRCVHVLAYVLRFANFKTRRFLELELSSSEIENSFELIVKNLQSVVYGNEVSCLKGKRYIGRKSSLSSIDPLLDEKGLMRAGGRTSNAPLSYCARFPLILPKSQFSEMLVRHYHEKYYHAETKLMVSLLKQRFWVPGLFRSVKKVIRSCKCCIVAKAKTYTPKMGQLPDFRLRPQKPFNETGIDFAGPVNLRMFKCRGKLSIKGYIALLVCMATKAIHLELVLGLDAESLVNALRRFLSRRGRCSIMWSDHGTNFVACRSRFLRFGIDVERNVKDPCFKQFLLNEIMEWRMIPPATPHMGGLWEASVKSTKLLLSKKFKDSTPTVEEFMTALAEIEALLNSRPLFAVCSTDDDVEVVTPSHLIQGFPSALIPFTSDTEGGQEFSRAKRYEYLRNIIRSFWKVWSRDYHLEMRKIYKWRKGCSEPKENDVVLIKRSNAPPSCWPIGRVTRIYRGSEGIVRIVDVTSKNGTKQEAARNLIPLEFEV